MGQGLSFRRSVASVLLAVYAAFIVLGGALVRCQEADGSTAIEWRGDACCVPPAGVAAGDPAAVGVPADGADDCSGCRDQLLSDTLTAMRVRHATDEAIQAPDVTSAPVAVLAAMRAIDEDACGSAALRIRAPHPPPRLEAIRSTVLRC